MRRRLSWRQICLLAGGSRPAAHSALPASARARRRLVSVSEVAHFDGSRSRGVARGERERERESDCRTQKKARYEASGAKRASQVHESEREREREIRRVALSSGSRELSRKIRVRRVYSRSAIFRDNDDGRGKRRRAGPRRATRRDTIDPSKAVQQQQQQQPERRRTRETARPPVDDGRNVLLVTSYGIPPRCCCRSRRPRALVIVPSCTRVAGIRGYCVLPERRG